MALNPLSWMGPLALPRLALLLNHVVAGEDEATARLRPHAGKSIDLRWSSSFSPPLAAWLAPDRSASDWAPKPLRLTVTRAGLFEIEPLPEGAAAAALTLTVRLCAPWTMMRRALQGEQPEVTIEGDAALAEVASWLMKNLRWDLEDDLAVWLGNPPAQALRALGAAVQAALQRWRPDSAGPARPQR